MANPFTAARDFLLGKDLPGRLPLAIEQPAMTAEEQKLFIGTQVWTPDMSPYVQSAFGGSGYGGDMNSAVFATLQTICRSYMDAPLRVFRRRRDEREDWLGEDDPFQQLVDDPHPSLTQNEIAYWLQYAKHCNGNAYLRKVRASAQNVVQLWPLSPSSVSAYTSKADAARGIFISHYVHTLQDGKTEELPVEDIIHFRLGLDDRDHRLGLSPLARLVREIASDDEATRFADQLLRNFAVPGLAVTIPPGPSITQEQAQTIRDRLQGDYGGENRGKIAVAANGAAVSRIGFSPQELDLKVLHRLPEERISAVFGPAAVVVGLGAGLDRSTFNNFEEAEEALYERTIVPLWQADAATWQKQLLRPDFTDDRSVFVKYDLTDVRALQPDMNEIYTRLTAAVHEKWVTPDEARSEVGLPPLPDGLGEAKPPAPAPPALTADQQGQDQQPPKALADLEQKAQALGAIPGLLDVVQELAMPAFEQDLQTYLIGQRQRVRARLTG